MESGALSRGLAVIDALVGSSGAALNQIAEQLDLPKSAVHRILANLIRDGYVRQDSKSGLYSLTLRLVSMGLSHLGDRPLVELARPVLNRLAQESEELVRLALVDGEQIVWVAKAQGAQKGLRFDGNVGAVVRNFASSATGMAWLSQLPDERALALLVKQGLPDPGAYGPSAPSTLVAALERINTARENGYAAAHDSFEEGTSAVAVPIMSTTETVVGVLSIAGPTVRLSDARILELVPAMRTAARELAGISLDPHLHSALR